MGLRTVHLVYVLEPAIAIGGLALLWRLVFSAEAKSRRPAPRLETWQTSPPELFLFLLHVLAGAFVSGGVVGLFRKPLDLSGDRLIIVATLASHLGMIAGVALYGNTPVGRFGKFSDSSPSSPGVFGSGVVTFLIATPCAFVAGLLWTGLLAWLGLPVERQPAVELIARLKSIPWLVVMAATATLIAPISEEFLFRAGMFRFLRTRIPRWAGLLLPATLFAALHTDLSTFAQLAVLGVIFSLAYERTGKIGTSIVAHALFNLNMLFMLLAGLPA